MTFEQLKTELDKLIPRELSEPWDNDGAMVIPNKATEITGVLCALDCTSVAIEKAKALNCNVILAHHPLIFSGIKAVTPDDCVGKRVIECIKNGIAVLSYHTRLDSMEGGVNDILASRLGIESAEAFVPFGRIGDISEQSFADFAKSVALALNIPNSELKLVNATGKVKRVAIISGCGKDEINTVITAGADTFVTGEVMHNHMLECKERGLNLICGTHYATERFIAGKLAQMAGTFGLPTEILNFTKEEEYGI